MGDVPLRFASNDCLRSAVHRKILVAACLWSLLPLAAGAADATHPVTVAADGLAGLNIIPDARVDPVGTVRAGVSSLSPYRNGFAGMQIAKSLYIGVRQTADAPSLFGHARRLDPGIDFKALLLDESRFTPAIAFGAQNAVGGSALAGEFLSFSKRYERFDFTAGLGWGHFANGSSLPNPFRLVSASTLTRAGESRTNGPGDWFSGRHVAPYAGIAWDAPVPGLTFKADLTDGNFGTGGRLDGDGDRRSWSAGFSYSPRPFMTFSAAIVGGDKIMGALTLQGPVTAWPGGPAPAREAVEPFPAYRAGTGEPQAADTAAAGHGYLTATVQPEPQITSTRYLMQPGPSLPEQLGQVVRPLAAHAGLQNDALEIQPVHFGLSGPTILLTRRDLENQLAFHAGSPQEVWRHLQFGPARPDGYYPSNVTFFDQPGTLTLLSDTETSLTERDHGFLYRTSVIADYKQMLSAHVVTGQALRVNAANNLHDLNFDRPADLLPVRSDEDKFADRTIAVDRSYIGWLQSPSRDWHFQLSAGYLEEMYGGAGGEILYRPFGKTWAIGAEAWEALKRTPQVPLATGFNGDHLLTGHVNLWYEIPGTGLTLSAKAGRYLAEDLGGTLGIANTFRNGVKLEAFLTATDKRDDSLYGGKTEIYSGIRLTLPLGNIPHVPAASAARIRVAPIGRDTGQYIDNPLPLYDLTEPMSYRSIATHWTDFGR